MSNSVALNMHCELNPKVFFPPDNLTSQCSWFLFKEKKTIFQENNLAEKTSCPQFIPIYTVLFCWICTQAIRALGANQESAKVRTTIEQKENLFSERMLGAVMCPCMCVCVCVFLQGFTCTSITTSCEALKNLPQLLPQIELKFPLGPFFPSPNRP